VLVASLLSADPTETKQIASEATQCKSLSWTDQGSGECEALGESSLMHGHVVASSVLRAWGPDLRLKSIIELEYQGPAIHLTLRSGIDTP